LDSDTFRLYRDQNANVLKKIGQTPYEQIWISGITVEETVGGWRTEIENIRTGKSKISLDLAYGQLIQVLRDLNAFNLLPYTDEAEVRFKTLKRQARNVGAMDLRLGAHALTAGKIVVTRNQVDFERIPGLRVEDWSK
jgi:tRNA(fMet)-specific endonuclease VapC